MIDPRPSHVPWLIPYLVVQDFERSLKFYPAAFGFVRRERGLDQHLVKHAEMTYHGENVLMFSPEGIFGAPERCPATLAAPASQTFYLYVEKVDDTYRNAITAGAKSVLAPVNMFWGDRFALVEDPDGYRWGLACHIANNQDKSG